MVLSWPPYSCEAMARSLCWLFRVPHANGFAGEGATCTRWPAALPAAKRRSPRGDGSPGQLVPKRETSFGPMSQGCAIHHFLAVYESIFPLTLFRRTKRGCIQLANDVGELPLMASLPSSGGEPTRRGADQLAKHLLKHKNMFLLGRLIPSLLFLCRLQSFHEFPVAGF